MKTKMKHPSHNRRKSEEERKEVGSLKIYQTVNINNFDKTFAQACNIKKTEKQKQIFFSTRTDRQMYLKKQKKEI